MARKSHREFIEVLQRKAERTESEMLQSYLDDIDAPDLEEKEQAP
jgi:hypothetical protein